MLSTVKSELYQNGLLNRKIQIYLRKKGGGLLSHAHEKEEGLLSYDSEKEAIVSGEGGKNYVRGDLYPQTCIYKLMNKIYTCNCHHKKQILYFSSSLSHQWQSSCDLTEL